MSTKAARRILWLALIGLLPVPFVSIVPGVAPVSRLLFLGGLTAGVFASDPDTLSRLFTLLLLGQAIGWGLVLYLVARLGAGLLDRWPDGSRRTAIVGIAVAVLLVVSLFPVYRTPLSSSGVRSNLMQILD